MAKDKKDKKGADVSDLIGGTLNIFGLKIDLADLLSSSEDMKDRLEELALKKRAIDQQDAIDRGTDKTPAPPTTT